MYIYIKKRFVCQGIRLMLKNNLFLFQIMNYIVYLPMFFAIIFCYTSMLLRTYSSRVPPSLVT